MRIIVVSDTHRDFHSLCELVRLQKGHADLFLHLGDGERGLDDLRAVEPDLPLRAVRGNCDMASLLPEQDFIQAEGVGIFLTHGHRHQVYHGLEPLKAAARRQGATVALYGHTHCQKYVVEDGIHVLNPGSLSRPRDGAPGYGVIDIANGQIICHLARI